MIAESSTALGTRGDRTLDPRTIVQPVTTIVVMYVERMMWL